MGEAMSKARRAAYGFTALAILAGVFSIADRPIAGDDQPKLEPGFRSLFNGKDLAGWHKNPEKIGHGNGGLWIVESGAITGEQDPPGSGNGGTVLTHQRFREF